MRLLISGPAEANGRCRAHVDERPDNVDPGSLDGELSQVIAALLVDLKPVGASDPRIVPVLDMSVGNDGERRSDSKGAAT